jgi:hypothetical protein
MEWYVKDWLFIIAMVIILIICILLFIAFVVLIYGAFASFIGFLVGAFWGAAVHAYHLFN